MRYLVYALGIISRSAGALLVLTAAILSYRGRPNSEILFVFGGALFFAGILFKRASWLKKCSRCREKVERDAVRCRYCGSDFPANAAESLSQPFYK
jgi:hypothetical protein